jgi:hypothetical protein
MVSVFGTSICPVLSEPKDVERTRACSHRAVPASPMVSFYGIRGQGQPIYPLATRQR